MRKGRTVADAGPTSGIGPGAGVMLNRRRSADRRRMDGATASRAFRRALRA